MDKDETMLQIKDTIVSLDIVERFFLCDLDACLGECCIEGDAGAPITKEEYNKIKEVLPQVWDYLLPRAQEEIKENGVGYIDEEGDLVTQIVDGKNCVFSCYGKNGMCLCAFEKAYKEGRIDFYKPISCHFLIFCIWDSIIYIRINANSSSWGKFPPNLNVSRLH